jgi:hypothetical protein
MLDQAFSSFYKQKTNNTLVLEEQEGIIKHLTHLEELILTRQKEGLDTAVSFINALADAFKGNTDSGVFTTVKYDGAPAIICGYNPENNKFFVSTKSIAAKTPKINYTSQDIQQNYGQAPGLAEKLQLALQYLPEVIKSNVYQCDFMFDKATLKPIEFQGEKLISFRPNTITYAVEADSELGKKIQSVQIGVVFHTRYTGPNLQQLTKSADVNVTEFNRSPNVWFDDAKFKDVSGTVTLTDDENKNVEAALNSIQKISEGTDWVELPGTFYTLANTYINSLIRQGSFVEDAEQAFESFVDWYGKRMDKEIEKLKSEAGKQKKIEAKDKAVQFFNNKKDSIVNIFEITKLLADLKKIFFNKYSLAIRTKQFLTQPDGTLKVTPGEGFVAVDKVGNMVKLVDRLEFSKANFAISKEEKFK